MKANAIYGQSGGPTSVINSSLYGVIKECKRQNDIDTLFIMENGIKGLIDDNIKDTATIPESEIEKLPYTPSAICGSVRYKLKPHTEDETDYLKILSNLKKYNIRYIYLNGGNDSMDTGLKLSKFLKSINYPCSIVGIPKTIDNDLCQSDHTPGFASAAKFICNTMQALTYDNNCYPKGRVNIVEIMGRDTGWLTASSTLANLNNAGPDLIYIPEVAFDEEKFLIDVKKIYDQKKRCLVAVSEGIKNKDGNFILKDGKKDVFNHAQLGGVCTYLANLVEEKLHISTRGIELSLLQRCFSMLSSSCDIDEAIRCGEEAVKASINGATGVMIGMLRSNNTPYTIEYKPYDLEKIANEIKYLPLTMLNKDLTNTNEEFIKYCYPLIQGKKIHPEENGLYQFANKKYF